MSKNLLLIKGKLFTMQRYINPCCIREVRGYVSVQACREGS